MKPRKGKKGALRPAEPGFPEEELVYAWYENVSPQLIADRSIH